MAVDGAFADFQHDKPYSTDGCLDIARKYADILIETDRAWNTQILKRNRYMTLENPNDFYLIIDSDEKLEGEIDPFLDNDYNAIPIIERGKLLDNRIRLIRHRAGIKYQRKHSLIWYKNRIVNQPGENNNFHVLDTCKIIHSPEKRSPARLEKDGQYIIKRQEPDSIPLPPRAIGNQKPVKPIRMKLIGRHYHGFDPEDCQEYYLKKGQCFRISRKGADQLLRDYPKDFIELEHPGKKALEDLKCQLMH